MTGSRYERKLIRLLREDGWRFVRSPSSGSGRTDDQPDIVASSSAVDLPPLGVEAKSTQKDAYTIKAAEADQLRRWCEGFGAAPVIAVYWKRPDGGGKDYGGWWFRGLPEVRRSPVENKRGEHHLRPRREDRHDWLSVSDLTAGRLPGAEPGR